MSLGEYLDERDEVAQKNSAQAARDRAAREWMNVALPPEQRLPAFDGWLLGELDRRLDWKWAGDQKEKRLHQCRVQVDTMIIGLWRRGWMLDGRKLADRVTEMLDAIGNAQRGGQVRDFWSYFKTSVERYVGLNSEELQTEAMSAGAAVGDVFRQLMKRAAKQSLPELVAQRRQETLREKISRQKQQDARKTADAGQLPLL